MTLAQFAIRPLAHPGGREDTPTPSDAEERALYPPCYFHNARIFIFILFVSSRWTAQGCGLPRVQRTGLGVRRGGDRRERVRGKEEERGGGRERVGKGRYTVGEGVVRGDEMGTLTKWARLD